MSSVIIGLAGPRGSSKTLSMTALAHRILKRASIRLITNLLKDGHTGDDFHLRYDAWRPFCISNYFTTFSDMQIEDIAAWLADFPPEAYNCLLLVDEVTAVIPSMRSMTNSSVLFEQGIYQIRKRHMNVIHTSQNPNRAGSELLRQTDIMIKPFTPDKGHTVYLEIWDQFGQWTDNPNANGAWPPDREPDANLVLKNASAFHDMYDTEQIVIPSMLQQARQKALLKQKAQAVVGKPDETPTPSIGEEVERVLALGAKDGASLQPLKQSYKKLGLSEEQLEADLKGRGLIAVRRGNSAVLTRAGQ